MKNNLVAVGQTFEQAAAGFGAAEQVVTDLGGPGAIVGRILGLGEDEMDSGIPGWAWAGIGFLAGAAVMYVAHDKVKRVID